MNHNNFYLAARIPKGGSIGVGTDLGTPLDLSAEFTVDAWVRPDDPDTEADLLTCDGCFRLGIDSSGLTLEIAGLPPFRATAEEKLAQPDWHHTAVAFDRQFIRFYVDGECMQTVSASGRGTGSPGEFRIGSGLDGRMRSLRIFSRGLSADEVAAGMFGPSAEEALTADFDFTCNPPCDRKNPSRTLRLSGGAEIIEIYPSLRLSGNAFASPHDPDGINPGGGHLDPYTVHAVVRTGTARGRQFIFANSRPQIDSGMGLYLEYDDTTRRMSLRSLRGSTLADDRTLISESTIAADTWVSVATTYDGEKLRLYIDGRKDAEAAFGPVAVGADRGNPIIGGRFLGDEPTVTESFQGSISRLEVWSRALSDEEIAACADTLPETDAEGLTCLFDFSAFHVRNEADCAPVCMSDGAIIGEYVAAAASAPQAERCAPHRRPSIANKAVYEVDPQLLQSFRNEASLKLDDEQLALCRTANDCAEMAEELALLLPEGTDIAAVLRKLDARRSEALAAGTQRFRVTQHRAGKDFYIAVHFPESSYIAYRCGIDAIDECVLLRIRLIFTLIVGIADILLGVKPTLTDKAVKFIQSKVLTLPEVCTVLAAGTGITAAGLFRIGRTLVSKGLLKELFKMILTLGFWALVRMAVRMVLSFLGVGAADMIASLAATVITFSLLMSEFLKRCLPFPPVSLYGIKFNHDLTQHTTSGLNLRGAAIPEWTPAVQGPVAYAIQQAGVLSIHARFSIASLLPRTVQIRANARPGSVLGNIAAFSCSFSFGSSLYTPLNVAFNGIVVGIQTAAWDWEYYDEQAQQWCAMGSSSNPVYLLMDTPQLPWTQDRNLVSSTLPSERVLRLACTWGAGVAGAAAAMVAPQIAGSVYGDPKFTYAGGSIFTHLQNNTFTFQHDQFMDWYEHGAAPGTVPIECSDCANLTALFSRLLGAAGIHALFFNRTAGSNRLETTFIKAVGTPNWAEFSFNYHVINVIGTPFTNLSPVFDACLQVNGDNDPWPANAPAPAAAFVPGETGHAMQYSVQPVPAVEVVPYAATNSYRERLFKNNVALKSVGINFFLIDQFRLSTAISFAPQAVRPTCRTVPDTPSVRQSFTLPAARFPAFRRTARKFMAPSAAGEVYAIGDFYETPSGSLQVLTYLFRSAQEARDGYFRLLQGAVPLADPANASSVAGETAHAGGRWLCFLRNNVAVRIFSPAGTGPGPAEDFARLADRAIAEASVR